MQQVWPGSREYLRSLIWHVYCFQYNTWYWNRSMLGLNLGLGPRLRAWTSLPSWTVADTDQFLWLPLKTPFGSTRQLMCVLVHSVCTHTHTYVGIHHLCYPTWIQNLWSITVKYLSTSEPSLLCITQIPTWIPNNDEVFFSLLSTVQRQRTQWLVYTIL